MKRHQWLSSRLLQEVLYLETETTRYEVSHVGPVAGVDDSTPIANEDGKPDVYRFSKCKKPLLSNAETRRAGVPLPDNLIEHVHDDLLWEEFRWAVEGLHLRGVLYPLVRVHFARRKSPSANQVAGLALADAAFIGEME